MGKCRGLLPRELAFGGFGRLWDADVSPEVELVVRKAVRVTIVTVDCFCLGGGTSVSGCWGHPPSCITILLPNSPKTAEQRRLIHIHIIPVHQNSRIFAAQV